MARGKHEGTINKRADGRWEAKLSLPGGQRKSFYGKTRKEAAEKLRMAQHDQDQGLPVIVEKQSVAEYLMSWLETVALITDASTQQQYLEQIQRYLLQALGKIPLGKLSAQHIQALYNDLAKRLAPATVRLTHAVLHHALKDAVRLGTLPRNPSEQVTLPRLSKAQIQPLSEEEAKRFLQACAGDRMEALFILAMTAGMRLGELLALHWSDIDWEHMQVHVRLALQETKQNGHKVYALAEPKTAHSQRSIALSGLALNALEVHRQRQQEEREIVSDDWQEQGLVFTDQYGNFLPYTAPYQRFHTVLKHAGIAPHRFHDLRHTFATMLLSRGVYINLVSEALGHANVTLTLNIYGHVLPHMHEAVATMMNRLLPGADEQESTTKATVVKTVVKTEIPSDIARDED